MRYFVTFFALFFATCGTCWSAGPSEPEDKGLRPAKKHSTKLKEIRRSEVTVQCSGCVQHKGALPCNFRDGALSIGPIDFSEIIPQNPELTLDEFLGLAQPKLKEQGLICDELEMCLDWATAGPIPENLSSSYITKLVVDSDVQNVSEFIS